MKRKSLRALACALALMLLLSTLASLGFMNIAAADTAESDPLATAKVGVMTGSTSETFMVAEYPKAQINGFPSISDAMAALSTGKLDFVVADKTNCKKVMRMYPDITFYKDNLGDQNIAMAVSKGNTELLKKLNGVLEKYQADGTLDEINARWHDTDGDYSPVDIPVAEGKNGVLKVAMSGDLEPFCFYLNGKYNGADCELIGRIAYELDMKVEYQISQFSSLITALASGKADLICSGMTATEERKQSVDFTVPYLNDALSAICKAENLPQTAATGARYGTNSVTSQSYLRETFPNSQQLMYPSIADAFTALKNGELDYVMASVTVAKDMVKSEPEMYIVDENAVDMPCHIAVSEQRPELLGEIDQILSKLKSDGTLEELNERWESNGAENFTVKEIETAAGTNGVLNVAISPNIPPICFLDEDKPVGINIELMDIIANELNMTPEYSIMDFDALLPAIQSGKVDVAIADINATDEGKELVDFTQSYYDNPQVLVANGKSAATPAVADDASADTGIPQYTTLSELEGKAISCQNGSVFDAMISKVVPNATFSYFITRADMVAALKNNKVEAVPFDEPLAKLVVAQNPDLTILPEPFANDHYGVALPKGSPLLAEVNQAIAKLKADGTLEAMKDKWTGSDDSVKVLPKLDYPGNSGVLRVAHDNALEPMGYVGADGESLGYDVELMLRVGEILDRKVELSGMDFGSVISMLQSGKADAGVGCMSITPERQQLMDISDSYYDAGAVLVVRKSVGETVAQTGFWDGLKQSFIRTFVTENRWKLVLDGLGITVLISICSGIFGTMAGFGICMLRRSKNRAISITTAAFIRLIQGTPIVVMLMILYYIIFGKADISAVLVSIVGFSINFGVYVSEMMRTGIDAVDNGQLEAARALGFTKSKTFWKITFPQAARHFLPVFKGEFISMVKMTSVVGYIAIQDLTKVSDIIRSRTLEAFFPLLATALIYFIVANLMTMLLSRLEIKLDPKRRDRTLKGVVMHGEGATRTATV